MNKTICPECCGELAKLNLAGEWVCQRCHGEFDADMQPKGGSLSRRFSQLNSGQQAMLKLVAISAGLGLFLLLIVGAFAWQHQQKQERIEQLHGSAKLVIYTTSGCGVCRQAKNYFAGKGLAYREYNLDHSVSYRRQFRELGGYGVPLIYVDGREMSGFSPEGFERLYRDAR